MTIKLAGNEESEKLTKMKERENMLNSSIEGIVRRQEISVVGFADLSTYENDLAAFGGDIVRGYPYGISIGIALPKDIVDGLRDRNNPNNASLYHFHAYEAINSRLDLATSMISSFLYRRSYRVLPIPAAERTDIENAVPTVSHKMVAHIAGLGWIGKNCLLITPEYGPRIRISSILTNAPLLALNNPVEQRCNTCRVCVEICPVAAIKGRNYKFGESREERFDFRKCQSYFEELKKDTSKQSVCGMCLYICPYGRDNDNH
jgi:epoxyqueuosine reductase QueG